MADRESDREADHIADHVVDRDAYHRRLVVDKMRYYDYAQSNNTDLTNQITDNITNEITWKIADLIAWWIIYDSRKIR